MDRILFIYIIIIKSSCLLLIMILQNLFRKAMLSDIDVYFTDKNV